MIELSLKKTCECRPFLESNSNLKSTVAQLVSCLPCARKVDCSIYTVREPLAGLPLMVRRLKGVLGRPDPCNDRPCTLKTLVAHSVCGK